MPLLQVVVLGIVQGLTEFLPISSTAHLYLTSWLLGWQAESLAFDLMLHLGTLMSVLIYFFRDWVQIVAHGFGIKAGSDDELRANPGLLWLLALGSIPIGVLGLVFNDEAETVWRTPWVMGGMLIGVGVVIWLADRAGRRLRDLGSIGLLDALAIGFAQALAIVPGCSRSGITISAGLFRGLKGEAAARFSFLLSTPAIVAAAGKAVYEFQKHEGGLSALMTLPFAIGVVVSGVTGCVVIAAFLQYLRRSSLKLFVYYRWIFGVLVLVLAFMRGVN